jgi:hypothetical protein
VEQEAGPLLVDAQSTKRKRAESLDERPTEPHEKKRKLRSTVVSEPGQIKANVRRQLEHVTPSDELRKAADACDKAMSPLDVIR